MLKYEGRMTIANKVTKQGKPLDGKHVFRNAAAQEFFDKTRNDSYVDDYGIDNHGKIYFAYLNGNIERYSRREFIKMAEE